MITRRRVFRQDTLKISIHGRVVEVNNKTAFIDELFIIDYKDKLGVDKITLQFGSGYVTYPDSNDTLVKFEDPTINLIKDDTYGYVRYSYHGSKFINYDKNVVAFKDSFINWNYIDVSQTIKEEVERQILANFKYKNIKFISNSFYGDIDVNYSGRYNINGENYAIKIYNPIYISFDDDSYFKYPVISMDGDIPNTIIATYVDDTDADSTFLNNTYTAAITESLASKYVYSVKFSAISKYNGNMYIFNLDGPEDYYEDDSQNPFYYAYNIPII